MWNEIWLEVGQLESYKLRSWNDRLTFKHFNLQTFKLSLKQKNNENANNRIKN